MFSSPPEQIDVTPVDGTNEQDSAMEEGKSKPGSAHVLSRGPTMVLLGPAIPISARERGSGLRQEEEEERERASRGMKIGLRGKRKRLIYQTFLAPRQQFYRVAAGGTVKVR